MPIKFTKNETYAYLAGLFDGEGCVRITNQYRILAQVRITTPSPLSIFKEEFGGGIYEDSRGTSSGKRIWAWRVHGPCAAFFLETLLPCLQVKLAEAAIALLLYDSAKRFHKKVPAKELIVWEMLRRECTALKDITS